MYMLEELCITQPIGSHRVSIIPFYHTLLCGFGNKCFYLLSQFVSRIIGFQISIIIWLSNV